ncbi:MAG: stage II sporulation protein R [Clostridia bacterium]|nr:stage II sporulation protein R [Clostridia bacterium]
MKRIALILVVVFILVGAVSVLPIHGESAIYDSVIRLHVLANSDSEEDQALKLTVRDDLLAKTRVLLADVKTRDEAEAILSRSLDELTATARATVRREGYDYPVRITLGAEDYPTREYENLAFPAGEYLSLRVLIGEAEGENWWCVLFPPLCLSAATDKREAEAAFLAAGLTGEQYRIITESENAKYRLRFKILEVAKELFD